MCVDRTVQEHGVVGDCQVVCVACVGSASRAGEFECGV
jgi:hypothetical protein